MSDDLLSRISAMDAQLAALQRDVARLDPAITRVDDNVDTTRHSVNNSIQVIANEVGTIRGYLQSLTKDLVPVINMAQEVKDARSQVSGASKFAHWIWPAITVLVAFAAIGYTSYVK